MARPNKTGLDYFPFDIDFFDDIKIRKLIKRQSGKAVTVYALLLCFIYKNGYYIGGDEELPFIISEKTGYDEVYIQEVIKSCISLGLFDKNLYETKNIFTSSGIQNRYLLVQKRNDIKIIDDFNLVNVTKTQVNVTKTQVNVTKTQVDVTKMPIKKRKEKESKLKEEKEKFDFSFLDADFKDVFLEWLDYKKYKNKKYKNQKSVEACYRHLKNLCNSDSKVAKSVVEQSMANNWDGLFPLKNFAKPPESALHTGTLQTDLSAW